MDYVDTGVGATTNYVGGLDKANVKRPGTALESVISRLGVIASRVKTSALRVDDVANAVIGFAGESTAGQPMPAAVPTSALDYLNEIESALSKLEYNLGRITQ